MAKVSPMISSPHSDRINEPILDQRTFLTTKEKSVGPNLLWIGLSILVVIGLVIALVVPLAVLANTVSNTTSSTICPTTAITTTVTSNSLPNQCSTYTTVDDETRSPFYTATNSCDYAAFSTEPIWIRFVGSAGSLLASCPIDPNGCGTSYPGWYTGIYPSLAGSIISGTVCYNDGSDLCFESNPILIINCNGFYVFYLRDPPYCDMRYCTI